MKENKSAILKQDIIYDNFNFKGFKKHRFDKIVNNISENKPLVLLDVACGRGHFYDLLKDKRPNVKYLGLEFSSKQVNLAKKKGYEVKKHDLTQKWPCEDNSVDIVFAAEIIEHILDTDYFIQECNRVLKKGGKLILTTPNIASLGDRFRLLFGNRPSAIENRIINDNSGHIRAFTYSDLYFLIKENNFINIKITGRDFYLPLIKHEMKYLGKINTLFSNLFPKFSAGFIVVARKK